MPDPQQTPTDPRPDMAPTPSTGGQTTDQSPESDKDQNASGNPEAGAIPTSTQENMGDGSGIRGDYGNASQTNGLEGGPDQPKTDTELTGS